MTTPVPVSVTPVSYSWVSSGRLARPESLEPALAPVALLRTAIDAIAPATLALSALADAEAFVRIARDLLSQRYVIGMAAHAAADFLDKYLTDAAHLLVHTNLAGLLDRFGVAPFISSDEVTGILSAREPVPSQFAYPMSADWLRANGLRLGSSTLRAVERYEVFPGGFDLWQRDVLAAFDDDGDWKRPVYDDSAELGALLITCQAQDPVALYDKLRQLWKLFSPTPMPEVEFGVGKWKGRQLFERPRAALDARLRRFSQYGIPQSSPDFVRLGTRDLIPDIGRIFADIGGLLRLNPPTPPSVNGLQQLADAIVQRLDTLEQGVDAVYQIVSQLVALLQQEGFSRLWIPVETGGTERIKEKIAEAAATRRDMQRLVEEDPNLILPPLGPYPMGPVLRHSVVSYERALQARAASPLVRFAPVENLLVAGVVVVVSKGMLASLLEQLLAPDADDADGTADPLRASVDLGRVGPLPEAPGPSALPFGALRGRYAGTVPAAYPSGSPVDREGPGERVSDVAADTAGSLFSVPEPRASVADAADGACWQLVSGDRPRFAATLFEGARTLVPAGSLPSYPLPLSEPVGWPLVSTDRGFPLPAGRLPVGTIEGIATPESQFPSRLRTQAWPGYVIAPTACTLTVRGGGEFVENAAGLEAMWLGAGYVDVGSAQSATAVVGARMWADLVAVWSDDAGGTTVRATTVRTEIVAAHGTPGSMVFRVNPALPCRPVVYSSTLSGIAFAGDDIAETYVAENVGGGLWPGSAGVTFEASLARRYSSGSAAPRALSTLQAVVAGQLVDADTVDHGAVSGVLVEMGTDFRGVPGLQLTAAGSAPIPGGTTLTPQPAIAGIGGGGLALDAIADLGDTLSVRPAAAWNRAYAALVGSRLQTTQSTGRDSHTLAQSDVAYGSRAGRADGDNAVLTVHAPAVIRVGMGVLQADTHYAAPAIAQLTDLFAVVHDGGVSTVYALGDLVVDPGTAIVGSVTTLTTAPAGVWEIRGRADTLTDYTATLVPFARHNTSTTQYYATPSSLARTDGYLVQTGRAVHARLGLCAVGDALLAASGRVCPEVWRVDVPALRGVSQRTTARRRRALEVYVTALATWPTSATPATHWTIMESASHVLAYTVDGVVLYTRHPSTAALVRTLTVPVGNIVAGVRYRIRLLVDPATPTTEVSVLPVAVAAESTASVAECLRSLDGYPQPGATIRLGRMASPMDLVPRLTDIHSETDDDARVWYLGAPPMAVVGVQCYDEFPP